MMRGPVRALLACTAAACTDSATPLVTALPADTLSRATFIGSESIPGVAEIFRVAVDGCRLAILDYPNRRVAVIDSTLDSPRFVGRAGRGPGELDQPRTVSIRRDGAVLVGDGARARWILYNADGELVQDAPLLGATAGHAMHGKVQFLSDGRVADFWWGDVVPWHVPASALTRLGLVTLVNADLQGIDRELGIPAPSPGSAAGLNYLRQAGDLAVFHDTVVVLRAMTGEVDWIAGSNAPRTGPNRRVAVRSYRSSAPLSVTRSTVDSNGVAMLEGVHFQPVASLVAVDHAGLTYVVSPSPFPDGRELLGVHDGRGALVAERRLPSRDSRALAVLPDGSLLLHGMVHDDRDGDRGIIVVSPIVPSTSPACTWAR